MAKRKYTRFSDNQKVTDKYECCNRKCKWQGSISEKAEKPVNGDINHIRKVCPKCGGRTSIHY